MATTSMIMVLFSLCPTRRRIAADKKPAEKDDGDDKDRHREKNTQFHDCVPVPTNDALHDTGYRGTLVNMNEILGGRTSYLVHRLIGSA